LLLLEANTPLVHSTFPLLLWLFGLPPANLDAQPNAFTVKSVSGTQVTFQLTNLTLSPGTDIASGAQGTLTLNGTITAIIPVVATNPIPAPLKR